MTARLVLVVALSGVQGTLASETPWFSVSAVPDRVLGGAWNPVPWIRDGAFAVGLGEMAEFEAAGSRPGVLRLRSCVAFDMASPSNELASVLTAFGATPPRTALTLGCREDGTFAWFGLARVAGRPAWIELAGVPAGTGVVYTVVQDVDATVTPPQVSYSAGREGDGPVSLRDAAGTDRFTSAAAGSDGGFVAGMKGLGRLTSWTGVSLDDAVAEAEGVRYASFSQALAAANGRSVTLLSDIAWAPDRKGAWTIVENGFAFALLASDGWEGVYGNGALTSRRRTGFVMFLAGPRNETFDEVYLDTLDLTSMTCGAGRSPAKNHTVEKGGPLVVAGTNYVRGVGVHAPSEFTYLLGGAGARFTAVVGADDDTKGGGASVNFQVLADGRIVYDSGTLRQGESKTVDVSLAGCDMVTLRVTDGGDGQAWDHADWCQAVFHMRKGMTHGAAAARRLTEQLGVLTPAEEAAPRINGPKVFGVRPSSPVLFKVPVTGARPMSLSAAGLPPGVTFDPATGVLGGACATRGDYAIALVASNAAGRAASVLTLKVGDRICLTPPLGWNSWNAFGQDVSDARMREQADALVDSGLAEHGWSYLVVDDCWRTRPTEEEADMKMPAWISSRSWMLGPNRRTDADGDDVPNTNPQFPDMKAMADYIHAKGLKAGVYGVPSRVSCCWTWGSFDHELADAAAWAKWGYDLVKFDWCYGDADYSGTDYEEKQRAVYAKMGDALRAQSRDIVYNVCNYGRYNVTNWASGVGAHYWRTNDDVKSNWADILRAIRENLAVAEKAGPDRGWNDPDMLVIGPSRLNGFTTCALSPNEQYTHVSLWAMMGAPLFIGCDLRRLDAFTKSLLTNDEVLAIDQDELGQVARPVVHTEEYDVWARPLAGGATAVALFNRGVRTRTISVDFSALGLPQRVIVRDVWRQKDLGARETSFTASIPGRATLIYTLRP